MNQETIYLDNNASTKPDPLVVEAVSKASIDLYANPSSGHHAHGERAAIAVEQARREVALLLDARPSEVVFTSGATEADNLALKGVWSARPQGTEGRDTVLVAATEHPAVLEAAAALAADGARVFTVPVDSAGVIDVNALEQLLDERTLLVSVMAANSETGTINPIQLVGARAHAHGALLHSDATQLVGRLPFSMAELDVDLVSMSGHKFHGPKGVGALTVRRGIDVAPQLAGGNHERGRRSGTLNVPGIVGLGVGAKLARDRFDEANKVRELRDRLHSMIADLVPGVSLNGHPRERLPNTLNLRFEDADAEAVMAGAPLVACSAGSACHSGAPAPSHVLLAMGNHSEHARESIRFGLSRLTTEVEVEMAAEAIAESVANVRRMLVGTS